jgi:hypothetical protein
VLGRLNKLHEAKVHMTRVAEQYAQDTEAQGVLGRVYKDLWRLERKDLPTLGERQQQGVATSNYIASAIRSYDLATRKHFDYYNAINVVSFLRLLEHLKSVTGEEPADCEISDLEDLTSVVRFAAQNALDRASSQGGQDYRTGGSHSRRTAAGGRRCQEGAKTLQPGGERTRQHLFSD